MSEDFSGLQLLGAGLAGLAVAYVLLGAKATVKTLGVTPLVSTVFPTATHYAPSHTGMYGVTRSAGYPTALHTSAPPGAVLTKAYDVIGSAVNLTALQSSAPLTAMHTSALPIRPLSAAVLSAPDDRRRSTCIGVPGDACEPGTECYAGDSPWAACIMPNTLGMAAPAKHEFVATRAPAQTERTSAPTAVETILALPTALSPAPIVRTVHAVAAPSAPPGMDTRFAYTAGAGITAALSENSIRRTPMSTTSEEDGYLLIERSGYQRRDYVLSVIVDCSKLPETERHLVSVQIPNTSGDPDIYFVPGVGVYARENGEARSGSVELRSSGLATIVYTIRGSTDVGSLQVYLSTGASVRIDAHVSWSTGANSSGHMVVLVHKSVIHASFFWAD